MTESDEVAAAMFAKGHAPRTMAAALVTVRAEMPDESHTVTANTAESLLRIARGPGTRGPWQAVYAPDTGWTVWHDPRLHGDMKRGAVIVCGDFRGGFEAVRNAFLVAAAPEMRDALRRAAPWLGKMIADGGHLATVLPHDAEVALQMVESAIKRAAGEEV